LALETHFTVYTLMKCMGRQKPEGKRPVGWLRHKWEVNIKMDCMELVWEGVNGIHLVQDRVQ
jgi:hypothetical protein